MTIDNRITGERNRLAILTYLHRFGWLTSRMLSALVWPDAKQALAMARRSVRALVDDKLILRRSLPDGGDCYTLSASGARFLNESTGTTTAKSGAGLALGNPVHRACSNWYLIRYIREGAAVWTEHEIQTGRAPLCNVDGKVPDGLVDTPLGLIWVEVENAWKNRNERAKVVRFCSQHILRGDFMSELALGHYLFRIAIVGTTLETLKAMVRSFADALALDDLREGQASEIELVLLPVDKSLVAGEPVLGNLWYHGLYNV